MENSNEQRVKLLLEQSIKLNELMAEQDQDVKKEIIQQVIGLNNEIQLSLVQKKISDLEVLVEEIESQKKMEKRINQTIEVLLGSASGVIGGVSGGAIVGAIIGSSIMPALGSIAGAVLGAIAPSFTKEVLKKFGSK